MAESCGFPHHMLGCKCLEETPGRISELEAENSRLKPCPFCGCISWLHEDRGIFRTQMYAYRVECEGSCHAMTCYWHTEREAIEAWNRRATPVAEPQEEPFNLPDVPEDHNGCCGTCHTYPCSCDQLNETDINARNCLGDCTCKNPRGGKLHEDDCAVWLRMDH